MGVQFNGKGKTKSYNYNGVCMLLDEPCFKRCVDCSPCTRIQKPKSTSIETPITHIVEVLKTPVSESVPEHVVESINKMQSQKIESIPTIINKEIQTEITAPEVNRELFNYESVIEQPQRVVTDNSTSVLTKKKGLWAKLTGFIKSIFKPRSKKQRHEKPKQPPIGGGNIYVWKNRKEGFGKKRVKNL